MVAIGKKSLKAELFHFANEVHKTTFHNYSSLVADAQIEYHCTL
jgi:hypothetical protein